MDKKLALTILLTGSDKLSGTLKKIVGLGKSGGQALGGMRREAKDLDRQLGEVRREISSTSGNVTALVNRERELSAAVDQVNQRLERQKRLLQIDNKVSKMHAQADRYMSAGQQNMMGGASILAPFVLASKGAMEFSSGMVDLQQKAELSNAELVIMRGNILAAAEASHQMPEDMREAVDVLAGFGMDAREAVKLAQPIGRLGTAFKVNLADGAAAAFANINNLKVASRDTGKAFDIMAAGGNAGAFEIRDMAKWFPKLTAQARALGQQGTGAVADLTAALQIARTGAGSADEAANNVSNLLAKINAPGTIRAFQKNFGIDLPAAMEAAYRKGKTPMEAIAEITQKATGGDLKRLGFAFEDMQAQSALRSLILNMEKYQSMRSDISKAEGTVASAFTQRELNDGMDMWNKFTGRMSETFLVLGTKLLPVASQFLTILGGMAAKVGDFAQANPELTTALLHLVAGLGAAKLGLGALQFAFGGLLKPMATVWGWWMKFRTLGTIAAVFPKAAKAMLFLRTATMFLAKGVMKAGLMMMANPVVLVITLIVGALALAGYLIYRHWDTIKSAFNAGIAKLGEAWTWLKTTFMRFPALFGPIGIAVQFIIRHWDSIKAVFNGGLNFLSTLPEKMLSLGKAIMAGLLNGIDPFGLRKHLLTVARNGINAFKDFFGIRSPSRLFMQMGGHLNEGLARGVDQSAKRPIRSVGRVAAGLAGAMAVGSAPAMAAGGSAPGGGSAAKYEIHIHQQPGEDPEALAKRVADELERRQRAAQRAGYRDA